MTSPFHRHHQVARTDEVFREQLRNWLATTASDDGVHAVADVGGGDGSAAQCVFETVPGRFQRRCFDLEGGGADGVACDITKPLPVEWHGKFDIVITQSAFEHFKDPFAAADNCVRLLRPGGLLLLHTVFAWRYHPVPRDYFRFSDDALRYMFEERNGLETLACGYDIAWRRWDIRGGYFGDRDVPPIDELGGFRENWSVFYAGRKP